MEKEELEYYLDQVKKLEDKNQILFYKNLILSKNELGDYMPHEFADITLEQFRIDGKNVGVLGKMQIDIKVIVSTLKKKRILPNANIEKFILEIENDLEKLLFGKKAILEMDLDDILDDNNYVSQNPYYKGEDCEDDCLDEDFEPDYELDRQDVYAKIMVLRLLVSKDVLMSENDQFAIYSLFEDHIEQLNHTNRTTSGNVLQKIKVR